MMIPFLVLLWSVHYSTTSTVDDDLHKGHLFDIYPGSMLSFPLDMTNVTQQSTKVPDKMGCAFACVGLPWCRSANFRLKPGKDGLHVCEMLSTDRYTSQRFMKSNQNFAYLSMKVRIEKSVNFIKTHLYFIPS